MYCKAGMTLTIYTPPSHLATPHPIFIREFQTETNPFYFQVWVKNKLKQSCFTLIFFKVFKQCTCEVLWHEGDSKDSLHLTLNLNLLGFSQA
jgi:hypothetical protein